MFDNRLGNKLGSKLGNNSNAAAYTECMKGK
jgi:hypothetical protein